MNDTDQVRAARALVVRVLGRHGRAPDRVLTDEGALHDVLFALVLIHTRLSRLGTATRALAPDVPFAMIRGMRDIAVHEPDRLQGALVAALVRPHLPRLVDDLDRLLARLEAQPGD